MPGVTALTADAWRQKQQDYWMFGTGAGITVLIAAGLGLLVGVVVVAQTIYSATVDHIREYGTLKAMGATNGYLYRVIVKQAAVSAVIGYAIAMAVALAVAHASQAGTTAIVIPGPLALALFVHDAGDVRRRIGPLHSQGHATRPCDGLQGLKELAMTPALSVRQVVKSYGTGPGRRARAARRRSRRRARRGAAHDGALRLRQDDAALDHGSDPARDRPAACASAAARLSACPSAPCHASARRTSASCSRASTCSRHSRRVENVALALDVRGRARRGRDPTSDGGASTRSGSPIGRRHCPADLSGGQKQRVAIARALVGDPDIILADEPTAALDSQSGRLVIDLLRHLATERGRAVVIVTHDCAHRRLRATASCTSKTASCASRTWTAPPATAHHSTERPAP